MIKIGTEDLEKKDVDFIRACVLKFISDTSLMIEQQEENERRGPSPYTNVRDIAYNILQIIDGSTERVNLLAAEYGQFNKCVTIRNSRLTDIYVSVLRRTIMMPWVGHIDDTKGEIVPGFTDEHTFATCKRLLRLSVQAD